VTWVAWRQGRSENALLAGLLLGLAALLVLTGAHMHSVFNELGLAPCGAAAGDSLPRSCALQAQSFVTRFDGMSQLGPWIGLAPGLFGVLAATPLVLEFDQGTYRLAWTQSITPRRWLAARIGFMLGVVVLSSVVLIALAAYWRHPLDLLGGRVDPTAFDLEGIVPFAYALFAASLVLAIGSITRRTGLAVAGGFGAYLLARLLMRSLREHLIPPVHALTHPPDGPAGIRHAWVISQSYSGPHGSAAAYAVLRKCLTNDGDLNSHCIAQHHILSSWIYQPASRFWPLQAIEGGVFLALSAVCLALAVWWIRNRIA